MIQICQMFRRIVFSFLASLALVACTQVDTFSDCVQQGYEVTDGNPATCTMPDGTVFMTSVDVNDDALNVQASDRGSGDNIDVVTLNDADPLTSALQQKTLPAVRLSVPFTPQAPHADWSELYNEACEEASLLMVDAFYENTTFTPDSADLQIVDFVNWQTEQGYAYDIATADIEDITPLYLDRKAYIYKGSEVTVENLKALLAAGYPIIIPAAGQNLGNPYFSGDGPPYHMLVLTGYDNTVFYTNDPGTRRGEGFTYSHETIMNTIHDWTGSKETIEQGEKAVVVLGR